jgi:hypothetical protein
MLDNAAYPKDKTPISSVYLVVQAPVAMATRDRLNMVYIDVVQIETALNMRRPIGCVS